VLVSVLSSIQLCSSFVLKLSLNSLSQVRIENLDFSNVGNFVVIAFFAIISTRSANLLPMIPI
jgi:hypothetical protein